MTSDTQRHETYKITSIKRTEEFTGELSGAIERAKEIDAEYQPAWGVQIEDATGDNVWDSEDKEL